MKTISLKKLTLLSLFGITLFSCTMEKRLHRKGYHVQWNNNHSKSKATVSEKEKIKNTSAELVQTKPTLAGGTHIIKDSSLAQSNDKKELRNTTNNPNPQENHLLTQKTNIEAIVASINKKEAIKLQKRIYSNTKRSGSKCVAKKKTRVVKGYGRVIEPWQIVLVIVLCIGIGALVAWAYPIIGLSYLLTWLIYTVLTPIAIILAAIVALIAVVVALCALAGYAIIMGLVSGDAR